MRSVPRSVLHFLFCILGSLVLWGCQAPEQQSQNQPHSPVAPEFPPALPTLPGSPTERTLVANWNLVSFPVTRVTNLDTFLQSQAEYTNIQSVWKWDEGLQNWLVYPKTGTFGLLSEVTPDAGYWIRARAGFELAGTGIAVNVYNFSTGWNLIGYSHSLPTKAISDVLPGFFWDGSCGSGNPIISVWAWEGTTWKVYFPDDADRLNLNLEYGTSFQALTLLTPGSGIWVRTQRGNSPPPTGGCIDGGTTIQVTTTSTSSTSTSTTTTTLPGISLSVSGTWNSLSNLSSSSLNNPRYTFLASQSGAIQIDLVATGPEDAYLYLLNSTGVVIAEDDDTGEALNARIATTLSTGTYTIVAAKYQNNTQGSFILTLKGQVSTLEPVPMTSTTTSTLPTTTSTTTTTNTSTTTSIPTTTTTLLPGATTLQAMCDPLPALAARPAQDTIYLELNTNTAGTELRMNWNPVRNARTYQVSVTVPGAPTIAGTSRSRTHQVVTYSSTAGTMAFDQHLGDDTTRSLSAYIVPGQLWRVSVQARNASGTTLTTSAEVSIVIGQPKPARPASLWASVSQGTADLAWCPVSGATTYQVRYSTSSTNLAQNTLETSDSSLRLTGLQEGTTYYAEVRAKISSDLGEPSSSIRFIPAASPTTDLKIEEFTLNQGVQSNLTNGTDASVPLIAGKPTMMHVFMRVTGHIQGLRGKLQVSAYRDNLFFNALRKEFSFQDTPRTTTQETLLPVWIELPSEWLVVGTSLVLELDPEHQIAETDETNNRFPVNGTRDLNFTTSYPLKIRIVPITTNYGPPTLDTGLLTKLRNYILAIYPNSQLTLDVHSQGMTALSLSEQSGWETALDALDTLREAENPRDTFYYGVFQNVATSRIPSYSGILGLAYRNTSARNSALSGIGVVFSQFVHDTMAHEIGHNHSLLHVSSNGETNESCGFPASADFAYPHSYGRIGKMGFSQYHREMLSLEAYHDIMSYCQRVWISDYHYKKIYDFQQSLAQVFPSNGRLLNRPSTRIAGRVEAQEWRLTSLTQTDSAEDSQTSGAYLLKAITTSGQHYRQGFDLGRYDHVDAQWFRVFLPTTESLQEITIEDSLSGKILYAQSAPQAAPAFKGQVLENLGGGKWRVLARQFYEQRLIRLSQDQGQTWTVLALDHDQETLEFSAPSGAILEIQYTQGIAVQTQKHTLP